MVNYTEFKEKYQKLPETQIAGIIGGITIFAILVGFLFLKLRRLLLAFIIGSSVASTIFSLSYLGISNFKFKGIPNYEFMAIYVPLLYGAFNVLGSGLVRKFGSFTKFLPIVIPALVGGIHGLVFSLLERYAMGNLPLTNFQFKEGEEWQVHLYAFIYYAAVYGVVLTFLNQLYFIY